MAQLGALRPSTKPYARRCHAAFGWKRNMYLLAGNGGSGPAVPSSEMSRFNVPSASWSDKLELCDQLFPENWDRMAVASNEEMAYCFGGNVRRNTTQQLRKSLYRINLESLICAEVRSTTAVESPSEREASAMVYCSRKLVLYGGYTGIPMPSDELFAFDLKTNKWTPQHLIATGDKPPALYRHTLTKIGKRRVAMFGGCDGSVRRNDTYILDVESWNWSKLETSGRKPPAREDHAACYIPGPTPGQHPTLMVVGGCDSEMFSDVWLLDFINGSWSEVALPKNIKQQKGHSAVVFSGGPDFRVVVLFGGFDAKYDTEATSDTTLLLLSWKEGSWVADRVVSSEELKAPDDSLREQLKRLKSARPHQYYDDRFPGVCFLGEPHNHEVPVQSEPFIIDPRGLGVSLKIPPGAVPPDADKPINVTVQACLSASTFKYPEGVTPLSAVYHISADSHFEKEVELEFEHFANLTTEKEAEMMTIFRAESAVKDDGKFVFTPIEGGKFTVGGSHCTLSTQHFCFICTGAKETADIKKRYALLWSCSLDSNEVGHAAVAVSLDDGVYLENFRQAVQEEWEGKSCHRHKLNVSFTEAQACVKYPSHCNGWNVHLDSSDCTISEEDVNHSNARDLPLNYYPPRVIFLVRPTENSEQCTMLTLQVTGIAEKPINLPINLIKTKPCLINQTGATEGPTMPTLNCIFTCAGSEIRIIQDSATSYTRVGFSLLNDRYGTRVKNIESTKRGDVEDIITQIYMKWMQEQENCSWTTLTECFRMCNLKRLASDIEKHFGFASPQSTQTDAKSADVVGAVPPELH